MFKVAVDLGYGYVKALSEDGRSVVFPSVVGSGMDRSLAAATLGGGRGEYHVVLHEEGNRREFFVGDLALSESADKTRAFEEDKIFHPATVTLLLAALSLVGPGGDVHLATGLPVAHYLGQRDRLRDFLSGLEADVEIVGRRRAKVAVQRVTLLPQAIGAFYSSILDSRGRVADGSLLRSGLVGIVDIGYKTVDYAVVDVSAGELRPDLCGSLDFGTSAAYHMLHREVERRAKRLVEGLSVELHCREGGRMHVMGREYNLESMVAPYFEKLARGIADRLQLAWRSAYVEMAKVLIVGGGALDVKAHVDEFHPAAEVVSEPQMANVRGYLRYATRTEEAERALLGGA